MRMGKLAYAVVLMTAISAAGLAQEAIGINFFDISQAYTKSYSCWDGGKSGVYAGSPATFTNCSGAVPVNMSIGNGSLVFQSTLPGGWWNIEFKLDWGHSVNFLRYGDSPLLYLRVKWGDIASGANLRIGLVDDQQILSSYYRYNGTGSQYSSQTATVLLSAYVTPSTTQWQDVYIPMEDFLANNPALDLTRISVLKFWGVGTYAATNTLYIEKMKIVPDIDRPYTDMIKINQLGYTTQGRKLAIVSYESGAVASAPTYFQVKDSFLGQVVYQASLQSKTASSFSWDGSGDIVYHADFTAFTTPGTYYLEAPQIGQTSPLFIVSDKAYNNAFADSLRFFYYARSGNPIEEPFAKGHPRPAIYTNNSACVYDYDDNNTAKMYDYDPLDTGITTRDVRGGWFDAGDLHLDVHNNITTLWFLLEILENMQQKLGPNLLSLPESDGQTNDLLLLIKYQLDWFKKMQNTDGSVHFMVITENGDQRYQQVSDVSSGAACILAGIFAKACPLFAAVDSTYANDLLARAELSWSWLMAHTGTYNPTDQYGNTWSYGITDDQAYRGFAAVELYIATGNSTYRTYFETRFNSAGNPKVLYAFGENNGYYGYINLIGNSAISKAYMDYAETTRTVNSTIRTLIRNSFIAEANKLVDNVTNQTRTYRVPMLMFNDLYWGSSGIICGNAYVLLKVYEWTGTASYRDTAADALDWIGGRNPVSRVFITGYGDYLHGTDHYSFYMFDHHNPVPGYLCGNINCIGYGSHWLDGYIQYPWKYYLNIQNAGLLEPCLHWQSQMCYLLGWFATDLKIPGDLDFNGTVEIPDLLLFSLAWMSTQSDPDWNPYCDIALPQDGIIDYKDFSVFAEHWKSSE